MFNSIFLLLSILILSSCGVELETEQGSSQIGKIKSVKTDDYFTDEEVKIVKTFCTELKSKEAVLNNYVANTSETFKFNIKQSDCDDKLILDKKSIEAFVETNGTNYNLSPVNSSEKLLFTDILTEKSSDLKDICSKTFEDKTLRYIESANYVTWLYFTKKCTPSGKDICIEILNANKFTSTKNPKVYQQDLIRVDQNSDNSKRAFVSERLRRSATFCSDDDEFKTSEQTIL